MAEKTQETVSSENALASTINDFQIVSNKTGQEVGIKGGIVEMSYYESIRQNTVRVNVIYADSGVVRSKATNYKSVMEGLPIVGSEKCGIKFTDNNGVTIGGAHGTGNELSLFVNKVTPITGDTRKSMISLDLVSKEFIMNERGGTRVVKRMDGKISGSIRKIFSEYLKTTKKLDIEDTDNNFNFIPSNRKPMYILDWLSKKSVPAGKMGKSAGFFFWETSKGFHFKSIDSLLDEEKNPRKKSIIFNNTTNRYSDMPSGYHVKAIEFIKDNKINVQERFKMGFQSTRIITFNPFNGFYQVKNTEADSMEVDTAGKELPKMNEELNCEGMGKNYTRTTYYVTDTGTLNTGNKAEEQLKKSKEDNFDYAQIENQAIRRYNQLYSSETTVTIAGDFSLHAGDTLFIDGPELKTDTKNDDIDKQHGGLYLISDLVHFLDNKGTWTKMNLVRDSFGRKGNHSSSSIVS
jgi:hypothetical protein